MSTVLVTGATGYIGGRLVPELLAAGHTVRCLARNPAKIGDEEWADRVEVVRGDVTDAASLAGAMDGVDAAYYLVHSMGGGTDFSARDREAAATFRDAAARASIERIVYLGGLGRDDDPNLSRHLQSRHDVGRVLADGPVPVIELRAAIIIGSGSASFEMLRYLVEVLPVMVTPRWVHNRCQPIAIRDVLTYLVAALDVAARGSAGDGPKVLEIGGPDVLTYLDMMLIYAEVAGLRTRRILPVPVLSPKLSSLWVGLVTPLPAGLARPLVESLVNEVVVGDHPASAVIDHQPMPFRAGGGAGGAAGRRPAGAHPVVRRHPPRAQRRPTRCPRDPDWAGGSLLRDEQTATTDASGRRAVPRRVRASAATRGWYVTPLLWRIRGWADKVVGGVGLRRGRRNPDLLGVGDAVDFWRVEAVEPDRRILLRAEMRLPGEAWFEWVIEPEGAGSRLTQRAIFYPRGLLGRAYWYALIPFHALIFRQLAERLAREGGLQGSVGTLEVSTMS